MGINSRVYLCGRNINNRWSFSKLKTSTINGFLQLLLMNGDSHAIQKGGQTMTMDCNGYKNCTTHQYRRFSNSKGGITVGICSSTCSSIQHPKYTRRVPWYYRHFPFDTLKVRGRLPQSSPTPQPQKLDNPHLNSIHRS